MMKTEQQKTDEAMDRLLLEYDEVASSHMDSDEGSEWSG